MKRIFLIIIILLVVVGAVIAYLKYSKETDKSVNNEKAEVEVSVKEIVYAYEVNETKANELFLNKVIVVFGKVKSVKEIDNEVNIYLSDNPNYAGVLCSFDESTLSANKVKPGDNVKIKGLCTGYLFDVVLNKCVLVGKN